MKVGYDLEALNDVADMSYLHGYTDLTIHETPGVQINDQQVACLSNVPYITDPEGGLIPLTEPGYVALHLEPQSFKDSDKEADEPKELKQLIFRVPSPDQTAAIFEGFAMETENGIYEESTKKLTRVIKGLVFIRDKLRVNAEISAVYSEVLYHAQVRRQAFGSLIEADMGDL